MNARAPRRNAAAAPWRALCAQADQSAGNRSGDSASARAQRHERRSILRAARNHAARAVCASNLARAEDAIVGGCVVRLLDLQIDAPGRPARLACRLDRRKHTRVRCPVYARGRGAERQTRHARAVRVDRAPRVERLAPSLRFTRGEIVAREELPLRCRELEHGAVTNDRRVGRDRHRSAPSTRDERERDERVATVLNHGVNDAPQHAIEPGPLRPLLSNAMRAHGPAGIGMSTAPDERCCAPKRR